MGRPRKATSLKKAQGTLQPCRTNEAEPDFTLVKTIPDCPEWFSQDAREIYYSTGLDLINQGILTGVSFPQFLNYCYFSGSAMELMNMIKEQGYRVNIKGQWGQNPNVKTLAIYSNLSRQFALEFGLTPVSSSKVSSSNKKEGSRLDEFI